MFDDFDPRDRDEDVRDIEMPWVELGRGPGSDRAARERRSGKMGTGSGRDAEEFAAGATKRATR